MKLTKNENNLLELIIKNPKISNKEIAKKLNITSQAIGKIKKNLNNKGLIDGYETILNYKKVDITCFAFTLVKIIFVWGY